MQLDIVVMSKTGGRDHNEDACGAWSSPGASFCVLSDGLGGHNGGEVASKLVVRHLLEWFRMRPACSPEAVAQALAASNAALLEEQSRVPGLSDMRATAVVLAMDTMDAVATWGHVGDSRLYYFKRGGIVAQTRDDSVVQEMVDAGYLPPQQLRSSPHRNKLLAALGNEANVEPHVVSKAFVMEDGDAFLLCSDGFWEYVEEEEMERTLAAADTAGDWLGALEHSIIARGRKGQDNYSAIAVWCRDPLESADAEPTLPPGRQWIV
ncbi:MAG: serine/threonine-protein phosphatase [Pseudolabrys sp.]